MGTGGREHGLLIRAVLSGVVGVLFGMLSYFAAAQIMLGLLEGRPGDTFYSGWCASAHLSFLLRATLYSLVVSQPHKATFTILKRMLQKAMEVLTREKTVPMIVRQLKTVCNADQILVLDRRKIVQGGTHDTLVTQRGIYRNFVIERTVSDCWILRESEMDREQGRQMKQCTHFCVHHFSCILCFRGVALFLSLA